jgi:hypothetical protein
MYVCMSVFLSVCLSACLSVCLSPCLFVYQSSCLFVFMSVSLPVCLSVCLSVFLSVCISFCLPVFPFGLFACLAIRLFVCTFSLSGQTTGLEQERGCRESSLSVYLSVSRFPYLLSIWPDDRIGAGEGLQGIQVCLSNCLPVCLYISVPSLHLARRQDWSRRGAAG